MAALRTKNDLNQDFLHYFLLIQDHYWSRVSSGSTYKSITKTNLKNLKVPVPPPKEQEKTVEKLDKIREKVNNMWDGFKRRKEILEILPKAVLDKAFTGELVEA
ncbi:hypothetical protein AKJ46_01035 [candidate division MSBL1 archaeon SCGC-AAA833K04]|uniref:Type I restriction modification DNA specificity domain-containing protein n=1 Tax=candidate division MSBL1 archaeon SCGC-AAA833K04 TaxID=1698258 RepID=A0A133VRH4_9EURY|nr:hypothetical protein AKJ46_01035 [candidate division MSBL1 archaeon SCGC-AAA833K04]